MGAFFTIQEGESDDETPLLATVNPKNKNQITKRKKELNEPKQNAKRQKGLNEHRLYGSLQPLLKASTRHRECGIRYVYIQKVKA